MKKPEKAQKFENFKSFYEELVKPLKKANPEWLRLDGRIEKGNRTIYAYFQYQQIVWKVDADTHFEKLKLAFDKLQKEEEPFEIKSTQKNKGKCLTIKGEPTYNKKFYVYATNISI